MRDLAFEYAVKVKKQWSSPGHRPQRVTWCAHYMNWAHDDWRKVIFFDESTFYVLKRKNQCKIWQLEREKLLPECLQQMNTGDVEAIGIRRGHL